MPFDYPHIKREEHYEDYHGNKVLDPYFYMENPEDPETMRFVKENNEIVDEFLNQDDITYYSEKLEELLSYTKLTVPVMKGNRIFYTKNEGTNPQPVIYMRDGINGEEKQIMDINTLSDDGTTASMIQIYSPHGRYMSMYISVHGSDWQNILIYDIDKEEKLEKLEWVTMSPIAWKQDESGFYYTKYPDQTGLAAEDQRRDAKLYFHKIGTSQTEDILIFSPESKEEGPAAGMRDDGRYLILSISESTLPENKLYFRSEEDTDFTKLIDDYDGSFYQITGIVGQKAYIQTSWNAKNNRVMEVNLQNPSKENWIELIPETDHVLTAAVLAGKNLLVQYVVDVKHELKIFDLQGNFVRNIDLPTFGQISAGQSYNPALWAEYDNNHVFFGFSSFFLPMTIYKYDLNDDNLDIFLDSGLHLDTQDLTINQVFYESKDGTEIPMYLIHKKNIDLDGNIPTYLYGYGGYNISILPGYSSQIYLWAKEGGVYAIANLRGGGEYGKAWHEQALLEKKQNVFDDFIAAAEWLIANNYTNSDKIAINGRSNGGLLVGATLVQRPDLFGAAIPQVGVLDMLRYPVQKDAGRYWTKEYGDAIKNPEHYDFLIKYSPYHNVKEGVQYPPTLVTAAESDDRVAPMHSKKFGAALQYAQGGEAPILVRIETKAGHGYGKPQSKIIEDTAVNLAFLKKSIMQK